jgi:hypothetical protein
MTTGAATTTLTIVTPVVSSVTLSNTAINTFIGGNFLQLYNSNGTPLFSNAIAVAYSTTSGNSNYGNVASNAITNLYTLSPNGNYIGPSSNAGPNSNAPDTNAAVTLGGFSQPLNAISSINYATFTSAVNSVAPSSMSQRQAILIQTAGGYNRIFQLTSSPTTIISL